MGAINKKTRYMQENGNDMGPLMPRLAGDIASKYVLKSSGAHMFEVSQNGKPQGPKMIQLIGHFSWTSSLGPPILRSLSLPGVAKEDPPSGESIRVLSYVYGPLKQLLLDKNLNEFLNGKLPWESLFYQDNSLYWILHVLRFGWFVIIFGSFGFWMVS